MSPAREVAAALRRWRTLQWAKGPLSEEARAAADSYLAALARAEARERRAEREAGRDG